MGKFVNVYNTVTGQKQRVPEHWLDHPRLGKSLSLTPSEKGKRSRGTIAANDPASETEKDQTKTKTQEDGNAEDHR